LWLSQTIDFFYNVYLIDASAGDIVLTLVDTSQVDGYHANFTRLDTTANNVTIQGFDSTQKIDGQTVFAIAVADKIQLVSLAANWYDIN